MIYYVIVKWLRFLLVVPCFDFNDLHILFTPPDLLPTQNYMVSSRSQLRIIFSDVNRQGDRCFPISERRRGEWLLEPGRRVYGTLGMFKRNEGLHSSCHVMNGAEGWITWLQVRGHQITRNSPIQPESLHPE